MNKPPIMYISEGIRLQAEEREKQRAEKVAEMKNEQEKEQREKEAEKGEVKQQLTQEEQINLLSASVLELSEQLKQLKGDAE
ncbi:hypothetical protein DFO73_11640 [Cytobacillus oceanisediminis]|uniref:Uncharacterized protein n=1 Tax=Cytobacillus oceanisediminis TaxID=665099 RepID=A0A2V2ZMR9_9BACI|nr:hypothetical protein [Cytobacillus oceanisediminis]PWW20226.1 hypothetical protein DFO73_11640 [Cytobacillus oceanisediminis]